MTEKCDKCPEEYIRGYMDGNHIGYVTGVMRGLMVKGVPFEEALEIAHKSFLSGADKTKVSVEFNDTVDLTKVEE
jgi:hypothetical protein